MTDLPAGPPDDTTPAEATAQAFHEAYERLAPSFSYKTREASAVPWADVPEENKRLMIAVAAEVAPLIAVRAAADRLQADINLAIKVHAAHCLACESPDRDRSNEHPPGLVLRGSFADLLAAQDTP